MCAGTIGHRRTRPRNRGTVSGPAWMRLGQGARVQTFGPRPYIGLVLRQILARLLHIADQLQEALAHLFRGLCPPASQQRCARRAPPLGGQHVGATRGTGGPGWRVP